jgi:hypothetical protein
MDIFGFFKGKTEKTEDKAKEAKEAKCKEAFELCMKPDADELEEKLKPIRGGRRKSKSNRRRKTKSKSKAKARKTKSRK